MSSVGSVKDLFVSFFSEKQMRNVEIGVDDIVPIYEDDSCEVDDVVAVGELVSKLVSICNDKSVGTIEFCTEAKEELASVLLQIEESANKMRMMENYSQGKVRTFRRIREGSRQRTALIDFVENGVVDLEESIKNRKFFEGDY